MTAELLDLDSRQTWHPDIEALVYGQEVWLKIEAKLDAGDMQGIEFLPQVRCAEDYLKDELAKFLRNKGREILFSKYTHVAGYHGCRQKNPASYQNKGIFPSNTEALISEARSLFADIVGFEEALKSIGPDYLNHNEGKVGLLLSAIRAKHNRNAYVQGSELIRGIAQRLGPEAESRYARTGRPTLIKCAIPVDWLDKHTTFPVSGGYINDVLAELIRQRKWPDEKFIGFDGGYMLTRAVPPENILEFIDMSDFSDEEL
jgi:hypothetical protein